MIEYVFMCHALWVVVAAHEPDGQPMRLLKVAPCILLFRMSTQQIIAVGYRAVWSRDLIAGTRNACPSCYTLYRDEDMYHGRAVRPSKHLHESTHRV